MLSSDLTYPTLWPVTYTSQNGKMYASTVMKVHFDDVEPYYTIEVLEGPSQGERQTVQERLSSWIDKCSVMEAKKVFSEFTADVLAEKTHGN